MKNFFIHSLLVLALPICCQAQHSLWKISETDTVLPVPESMLFYGGNRQFYVSMVDGKSMEKDGKGSIYLFDEDGQTVKEKEWNSDLDAPKGMASYQGKLYVADLKNLVLIDQYNGKTLKKFHIDTAGMLNDLSLDPVTGTVYVSDSKNGKIYRLREDRLELWIDHLVNPNGLLWLEGQLYYLDSGILFRTRDGLEVDTVATGMAKDTDGLQDAGQGNFLVSAWSGAVYFVSHDGGVQQLLDSRSAGINTADFYYDKNTGLLYIPTFYHRNIMIYELK